MTGEARRRHVNAHRISGGSVKMTFATVARADAVVVAQSAGDVDVRRTAVL